MNTNNLRCIAEFISAGSITGAAKALGISRSSVLRGIEQLEEELNTKLFFSTANGPALTSSGSIMIRYADEILAIDDAIRFSVSNESHYKGTVDVGMGPTRAQYILPQILPGFLTRYPHVTVRLHDKTPIDTLTWFLTEHLDLAILGESAVSEGMLFEPFTNDQVVLVPRNQDQIIPSVVYERGGKSYVPIEAFTDQPIICGFKGQQSRTIIDKIYAKFGKQPKIVFECHNGYTIAQLAKSGLAYGFCAESALQESGRASIMKYYYLDPSLNIQWAMGVATLKKHALSMIACEFKNHLISIVRR